MWKCKLWSGQLSVLSGLQRRERKDKRHAACVSARVVVIVPAAAEHEPRHGGSFDSRRPVVIEKEGGEGGSVAGPLVSGA